MNTVQWCFCAIFRPTVWCHLSVDIKINNAISVYLKKLGYFLTYCCSYLG